jgi:phospholipid/cholesterol/gamma-HCH transport system permease protein
MSVSSPFTHQRTNGLALRTFSAARNAIARSLAALGRSAERTARQAGSITLLARDIARAIVTGKVSLRDCLAQGFEMGVASLPLVLVIAILAGVVTAQQGGYQFTSTFPVYIMGSVVTSSIVLELGPVLTGFVFIGRVGARITAELGSMQVSEQIDALHALGRDPVGLLAAPRLIAGILAVPILVGIADVVGVFAGMFAARSTLQLGSENFFYGVRIYWHNWDLLYSLSKGLAFGFLIPLISIHGGLSTRGGAEGVGRSTTGSVVFMMISMLVVDAMFPPLLLNR